LPGVHPITVTVTIAKPREEVFAYLQDIANHAEFTDHFLVDWHLTREDSVGVGAGARYKVTAPLTRFPWGDSTITEVDAPRRLVEQGRSGKFNRIRTLGVYELETATRDSTRLTFTFQSQPKTPSDRFLESLGGSGWLKRKNAKAMRRLKAILEEGLDRGTRPTIAGGARKVDGGFRFDASRASGDV
jgi:uncharacterized protein YndB with AHSA1/START domain